MRAAQAGRKSKRQSHIIRCFNDFLSLLVGDLEFFRYPVFDLQSRYGNAYLADATFILQTVEEFALATGVSFERSLQSYAGHVQQAVLDYQSFQREGHYRCPVPEDSGQSSCACSQRQYLCTLALSTAINRSRYELFQHYRSVVMRYLLPGCKILEVGSGNCLDAVVASRKGHVDAYELNPFSRHWLKILRATEAVMLRIGLCAFDAEQQYDFVAMIELLEHLSAPAAYVTGAYRTLKEGGYAYLTFALRMPQSDHLFQFNTLEECRDLVLGCGFCIVEEFCTISTYRPFEEHERWQLAEDLRYAVIYCCLAKKAPSRVENLVEAFIGPCDPA